MMKISVILPTYNERGNIGELIQKIDKNLKNSNYRDFEILVVDDNSTDGTAEAVIAAQKDCPTANVFVRKDERGLASAIHYGIKKASGDVFVLMDSDFNHDPKDVPRLLEHLDRYDIVIGSRYVKGGRMGSSWIRHYLSLFFNLFVRVSLNLKTADNLSGFIALKRHVLDSIDMDSIFVGFGEYHIPFIYEATKIKRFSAREIPVIYQDRKYGNSKFQAITFLIDYTKKVLEVRKKYRSKKSCAVVSH